MPTYFVQMALTLLLIDYRNPRTPAHTQTNAWVINSIMYVKFKSNRRRTPRPILSFLGLRDANESNNALALRVREPNLLSLEQIPFSSALCYFNWKVTTHTQHTTDLSESESTSGRVAYLSNIEPISTFLVFRFDRSFNWQLRSGICFCLWVFRFGQVKNSRRCSLVNGPLAAKNKAETRYWLSRLVAVIIRSECAKIKKNTEIIRSAWWSTCCWRQLTHVRLGFVGVSRWRLRSSFWEVVLIDIWLLALVRGWIVLWGKLCIFEF